MASSIHFNQSKGGAIAYDYTTTYAEQPPVLFLHSWSLPAAR